MIYEINHIWPAEMKWKWRNDRRIERNLCNCIRKPEKISGLQRGLNPFPRDTGAMLNQLSYQASDVVHIWFISYIINTHLFHGNIWTNNWPAPNVSSFIAQLVEHRTIVTGGDCLWRSAKINHDNNGASGYDGTPWLCAVLFIHSLWMNTFIKEPLWLLIEKTFRWK